MKLIDTPFPGPRRLRFDSKGNLWIPGFSAGLIARYSTSSGAFKTWKLPIDGVETPYALNVDRRTDTVWVCGTNSDSLISFEDGKPYRLLRRHLRARGLTPQQYRAKWGLPPDYPMVAPNLRLQRIEQGKARRTA